MKKLNLLVVEELSYEQKFSIEGGALNSGTVLGHTIAVAQVFYSFAEGFFNGLVAGAEDAAEAQK